MRSINRRQLLVVAVALMCLTAMPGTAAAQNEELVVGSLHSTETDFSNAQKLENMTVSGSGSSAVVTLTDNSPLEGFEDGDTNIEDDSWMGWHGETGSLSAQTSTVISGSYSGRLSATDTTRNVNINRSSPTKETLGFSVQQESVSVANDIRIYDSAGDFAIIRFDSSGNIVWNPFDQDKVIREYSTGTVYDIELQWDWSNDEVEIIINGQSEGTYSFSSSASDYEEVQMVVGDNTGSEQAMIFDDIYTGSPPTDDPGRYVSATHDVSNAEQAAINITEASNVSVNATVRTDAGTVLNETEFTSAKNHTMELASTSSDKLEVVLDVSITGKNPAFELADESILFNNHYPEVDNASASPSGGTTVSETPVQLSINVSDADFGTAQGEAVDVEFQARHQDDSSWSTVDTITITSNQTVSTSYSPSTLGVQEWRIVATDSYGGQTTSETFTFETPNTVTIRNETDPSQVIGDPVNTTLRFFGEEQIFERTSSDGTVDMTGLPNEMFIVEVSASEDYHGRTVFVESIYDQQTVYLLNKNVSSVESRFTLDDPTGTYGPETILFIEKPITRNNTTKYRTIHADRFGAEGVTAVLEQNQRYRLRVRSMDGTTQVIGPYRAAASETVSVSPGAPSIGIGEFENDWGANAALSNRTLEYRYSDTQQLTDTVTIWIHERGNESNQLVANETFYDVGNVSNQLTLTANESKKSWVVNFVIDRDGKEYVVSTIVRNNADLVPDISDEWRLITGIGLLLLSAGTFSVLNASVGAVVVSLEGGILWWTGWLGGATAGVAVIIAIFISVMGHMYTSSGP